MAALVQAATGVASAQFRMSLRGTFIVSHTLTGEFESGD
jgi:hypothetical protein